MVKEAEAHAADDKKRREEAETRNTAEQKVYMTEKFLKDDGDKVSEGTRNEVQTDIDAVKKALEGDDIEAVKSAMTKLDESSLKIGQEIYAAQQAEGDQAQAQADGPQAGAGQADASSSDDDVIDAEIVDEEDDDK